MNPTPRTDAEVVRVNHHYQLLYPSLKKHPVDADFARQLERELAEANERAEKWEKMAEKLSDTINLLSQVREANKQTK